MKRPNFFTAKPFDDKWQEAKTHVRLWRATLDQLLQDLIYMGGGKEDRKAHLSAWEWFENEQDAFDQNTDQLINSIEEWFDDETYYSSPRRVEIGFSLELN